MNNNYFEESNNNETSDNTLLSNISSDNNEDSNHGNNNSNIKDIIYVWSICVLLVIVCVLAISLISNKVKNNSSSNNENNNYSELPKNTSDSKDNNEGNNNEDNNSIDNSNKNINSTNSNNSKTNSDNNSNDNNKAITDNNSNNNNSNNNSSKDNTSIDKTKNVNNILKNYIISKGYQQSDTEGMQYFTTEENDFMALGYCLTSNIYNFKSNTYTKYRTCTKNGVKAYTSETTFGWKDMAAISIINYYLPQPPIRIEVAIVNGKVTCESNCEGSEIGCSCDDAQDLIKTVTGEFEEDYTNAGLDIKDLIN